MSNPSCVQDCLNAQDPLKRDLVEFLIDYSEEDDKVDYKADFVNDQPHWLELTKDLSAFANTHGGYLVFGIDDSDHSVVGIGRSTARLLKDANNILQKVNRNLEPPLTLLRAKEYRFGGKSVVCVHLPRSKNVTHLVSKDGEFTYPSGKKKTLLRQGTFFVRRSGGNHLGDSRDLDAVFERRVEQFQEALKEKIATVIEAPVSSEVLITAESADGESATKFVLSDSEDAVPVIGMTFTKPPETTEQEIMGWRALTSERSDMLPSKVEVWRWYRERAELQLDQQLKLALFKVSLWSGVPCYYWIRDLSLAPIRETLFTALRERPDNSSVSAMLEAAAFLGKKTYREALKCLGSYKTRISPSKQSYPSAGPRSMQTQLQKPAKQSEQAFQKQLEKRLNDIASVESREPKIEDRWEALKIDILLYARDDQYKQ